jgi:uncharacterized protein YbaP (TraB family)
MSFNLQGAVKAQGTMLFQINESPCHLLGTVHMLPKGEQIPASLVLLAKNAQRLVVEHQRERPLFPVSREEDFPLSDEIDANLYRKLAHLWAVFDIKPPLESMPLWRVDLELTLAIYAEMDFGGGVDAQVMDAAMGEPKALETFDSVLERWASTPSDELIRNLDAFSVFEKQSNLKKLCDLWRKGDLEGLQRFTERRIETSPHQFRHLIQDRNRDWIPSLAKHLGSRESTLIVVGCMHLAGPDSLPELLVRQGFRLRQIPY